MILHRIDWLEYNLNYNYSRMQPARRTNIHFIPASAPPPQPQQRPAMTPTINEQTKRLYEQLRQRQIEYINLIRDLHAQNHRLKALLTSQSSNPSPIITIKPPQPSLDHIPSHTRTPSFNSLAGSRTHAGMVGRNHPEHEHRLKSNNRFSFGDIAEPILVGPKQPTNTNQISENSIDQNHLVSHTANQQEYGGIKTEAFHRVFNNLLNPYPPSSKLQSIRRVASSKNMSNGHTGGDHILIINNEGSNDRQWNARTNKSISKSSSRSSNDEMLDQTHKHDHISEYSEVCSRHPHFTSSNKLKRLLHSENSPNSVNISNLDSSIPSLEYIPQVMETKHSNQIHQRYQRMSSFESVPDSLPANTIKYLSSGQSQAKHDNQRQIGSQFQPIKNVHMQNVNETLIKNHSPRNKRPIINNKIYL